MLSKAIAIAEEALNGKLDVNGNPYIDHAMRVMDQMDTDEEKIAAVLHDVVEDSEVTEILAWPISSLATLMGTPARWRSVQNVWRRQ